MVRFSEWGYSKRSLLLKRSFVVLSLFALLVGVVASFSVPAPALASRSRCNASNAGDFDSQVRDFSKRAPSEKDRAQRYADLDGIINSIAMEEGALVASCDKESDRQPIDSQLHATAGWALVQQADIAQAVVVNTCPAAQNAEVARLLATAWYELAKSIPEGQTAVPKAAAPIVTLVQSRAAAAKLTLPAMAETSTYWRDQVAEKAKAAAACQQ